MKKEDLTKFRLEIRRLYREINLLASSNFNNMDALKDLDKYLVILINGYAEKHFEYIIKNFCEQISYEFSRYVSEKNKKGFTNLNSDSIKNTLCFFNENWEIKFKDYIKNNDMLSESLGQIYRQRIDIAHCNNLNINIRRKDCIGHYINIIKLMRQIEKIVKITN